MAERGDEIVVVPCAFLDAMADWDLGCDDALQTEMDICDSPALRRGVRSKPIGDHHTRLSCLALQEIAHQAFGRFGIANANFTVHIVYEEAGPGDAYSGRPTLEHLRNWVPANADAYFLGPKPFMSFIDKALNEIGIPSERREFEFFGPLQALN